MISIRRAKQDNRVMLAVIGQRLEKFNSLVRDFEKNYQVFMREEYSKKKRIRKMGGGSKAKLKTAEEKLFFILLYFKCYPTFDLLSLLFDLDRGHCCRWVHRLTEVLERTLGEKQVLPARKINSLNDFLKIFSEAKTIFIDGVERPRRRPKDNEKQKKYYSGKKKRHTLKNLVVTNEKKEVKVLSGTYEGKKHDFSICKEEKLPENVPEDVETFVDTGFEGIEKHFPNLRVRKPKKKPKKKELTEEEKEQNKNISRVRIKVEHAIGGVKRFNIVAGLFRNIKKEYDDKVMLVSSGLWNYHLRAA